jgi:hypothetical protein
MEINKYKITEKDEKKFEVLVKSFSDKLESSELITEFKELIRLLKHQHQKRFIVDYYSEQTNGAKSAIKYLFNENWETIIDSGYLLEIRKSSSEWMHLDCFKNVFLVYDKEIIHAEKDNDMFLFYQAFKLASKETYSRFQKSTISDSEDFDRAFLIKLCFETLMNRLKSVIHKKESLEKLSHYKLTVITGLILKDIKNDGINLLNDSVLEPSTNYKEIHNSLVPHTRKYSKICNQWLGR